MGLVSKGIPWDVALSLDPFTQLAWIISMGEMETGDKFDFDRMEWPEKKGPN